MVTIHFFKSYSIQGQELQKILEETLSGYMKNELNVEIRLEIKDSKGLNVQEGNAPLQVLTATFQNDIVIIDGSIEEFEEYPLGANYECVTPAVSSFDNILVVSRTQLPLNFIPCRSNVARLGEKDFVNHDNDKGGYKKAYTNDMILTWLKHELKKMYLNNRLVRPEECRIDFSLSYADLMQKEMQVIEENMVAVKNERELDSDGNLKNIGHKKKIFLSYRTRYARCEGKGVKYLDKYDIEDVKAEIIRYHKDIVGDGGEWDEPFCYPQGVLSNEFMPEIRRWAFVSIPDRKIRECDEFWIFNTNYKPKSSNGSHEEVGYWDSWWCLGEFLTIVRMKYQGDLKDNFKVMLFSPDKGNPIEELPLNKIPNMTDEQNRELARYFANGDFLEAGMESMGKMRKKKKWSIPRLYVYFWLMRKFVWPNIMKQGDFKNYPFKYYKDSVDCHVYDIGFVNDRILECSSCKVKGRKLEDIINDNSFVWRFLNVNGCYTNKYNVPAPKGVVKINDEELQRYAQKDNSYLLECQGHHKICVKKSEDCFYIFWTPRNGKATGPENCVIEKVDLYEVVE